MCASVLKKGIKRYITIIELWAWNTFYAQIFSNVHVKTCFGKSHHNVTWVYIILLVIYSLPQKNPWLQNEIKMTGKSEFFWKFILKIKEIIFPYCIHKHVQITQLPAGAVQGIPALAWCGQSWPALRAMVTGSPTSAPTESPARQPVWLRTCAWGNPRGKSWQALSSDHLLIHSKLFGYFQ